LPGFNRIAGPLLRTPAQGADTAAWLAASPAAPAIAADTAASRASAPASAPAAAHAAASAASRDPTQAAGVIWHDRRPRPAHRLRSTRETASERAQLFEECLARTAD